MQIENEFTVAAAADRVFETLLDLQRIGPCIPGASIGSPGEDGSHRAEIAVRLGPMRLTYRGTVRIQDSDRKARRASLAADVREARGQGNAKATMTMTVTERNERSVVSSATEVDLSGRAAQMGAGIVEDVAARLVADMAANLERMLADEPSDPPAPRGEVTHTGAGQAAAPEADSAAEPPAPTPPPVAGGPAVSPAAGAASPPPPPAAPIGGFRLLLRALWYRLRQGRRGSRQATPRGGS